MIDRNSSKSTGARYHKRPIYQADRKKSKAENIFPINRLTSTLLRPGMTHNQRLIQELGTKAYSVSRIQFRFWSYRPLLCRHPKMYRKPIHTGASCFQTLTQSHNIWSHISKCRVLHPLNRTQAIEATSPSPGKLTILRTGKLNRKFISSHNLSFFKLTKPCG